MPDTKKCRIRVERLEDRTAPAAGLLDPTFGVGGRVTTRFPIPSYEQGSSTAVDGLGRIVVAGSKSNGSDIDFVVARYTSAGAPDLSFGDGGVVTFPIGASDDFASSVAIDSLNRIVVAGYTTFNANYAFAVARLTAAGALDVTFDSDGRQTVAFGTSSELAFGVAVDPLDRVVVAGSVHNGTDYDIAVARLTAAGALDSSFDGDGKQTIAFGSSDDFANAVAVDSLDRIVLAGNAGVGSTEDVAVARLTAAGALDGSFDGDGKQTIDFGSNDGAHAVAVDSLGRVVLAGFALVGSTDDFAVARLTAAGAPDGSFDGDGKQTISFGNSVDIAYGVGVDSLDRVVVAGYTFATASQFFAVARLAVNGALDGSFDGDGRQTVAFAGLGAIGYGVAVDSLDRVVVAGAAYNGADNDLAVARLTTAGAPDDSFDGDGQQTLGLTQSQAYGRSVAVDSLGRTVVAGYVWNGSNNSFAVMRYTSAGALDPTFGGTGIVTFASGQAGDLAFSVAVDSLDRVVVAGATFNGNDYDFAVARLTAAGALDGSFDGDGRQTIDFGALEDMALGVAVDSLDRVVVAGATFNGNDYDFAVARLTAAGALDGSFDGDGRQTIAHGAIYNYGSAMAVDSLDRIVVVGSTFNGLDYDFVVARLTAAGALDGSFDGDGRQTVAFADDYGYAVAVDSVDRVVVAGVTYNGADNDFAVARLTAAGALDGSFDGDGRQTIDFGDDDGAFCVAVDSLDRVVVAGNAYTGGVSDFAVARLTPAGALDGSFDADGKQTIDFGVSLAEIANGVAVTSAGQVVLAGISNANGYAVAVARLTGDAATASAQVNDGAAQRSRVTSLTVRFSGVVTFSGPPAAAFTLARAGGGAVGFVATVGVDNGRTVVTLTNFTGPETEFGSLRDGRYTLTALAAQISAGGQALDGNGDGTPGDDYAFDLFRLFGDATGDGTVNAADFALFRGAFGTSTGQAAYVGWLDVDGDGFINAFDFAQFRTRFGSGVP